MPSGQSSNNTSRGVSFVDQQHIQPKVEKKMNELKESSDFIKRYPESLLFVAHKVFQALDSDSNAQISWPEVESSFLGNLENLPFHNKEELKECFYKWAAKDENTEELSFDEFVGFFEELVSLI